MKRINPFRKKARCLVNPCILNHHITQNLIVMYAPQAVLDAARQNALQEHAQTLAYMERDLADGVAEAGFSDGPE